MSLEHLATETFAQKVQALAKARSNPHDYHERVNAARSEVARIEREFMDLRIAEQRAEQNFYDALDGKPEAQTSGA